MIHTTVLKRAGLVLALAAGSMSGPLDAQAGVEPFIGEIMMTGYSFCPRGYAETNGQLLAISQNTALFSLLGTTFGGDGRVTFALPDLRGRVPIGQGQGPGLSSYTLGQVGGAESFTLTVGQMPAHNHGVQATNANADKAGPGSKFPAVEPNLTNMYHDGPPNRLMNSEMITPTGQNQPVGHRSPYLTLRFCIALQGVFPSRN
jgi:microcystin-dependent protein